MPCSYKPKRCQECGGQFTPTAGPQVRHPACQRTFALRSAVGRMKDRTVWVQAFKIGKSCVDCGLTCTEGNFPAFDWDHRPGVVKAFKVSEGQRHKRTEVLAEIAKCDLRCKNCHAIITHLRQDHLNRRKAPAMPDKDDQWAGKGFGKRNEESKPEPKPEPKPDEDDWIWE